MKAITNNASYKTGMCFTPKVDCEVHDVMEGKRKWWYGCVCIGEEYYEADRYRDKDYALAEMIGYLEGLDVLIKKEIENLKGMMK